MPDFSIIGDTDPFLHVTLQQNEKIFCESNAMVMMEANLDLNGRMNGGFLGSLARRMMTGESFFQQNIQATRGVGDCLLSPTQPGAVQILEVDATRQYCLSDGAFLAATEGVNITTRMQSLGGAFFGGTGGLFIMEASGQGKLAVSGFGGSIFTLDVVQGKDITIDNSHVVAWDKQLVSEATIPGQQGGGLLGRLVNSVTSGEGIVLKFRGNGKVVICSRNKEAYVGWLQKTLGGAGNQSNSSGGLGGLL
jgi:uncharacterized protein (TIGR00266 family)